MKFPIILSSMIALASFVAMPALANAPTAEQKKQMEAFQKEQAAQLDKIQKSANIKQGLIDFCVSNYTKHTNISTILKKEEISKVCSCNVKAEGSMTQEQQWQLQSLKNANKKKEFEAEFIKIKTAQGKTAEACMGKTILTKLQPPKK